MTVIERTVQEFDKSTSFLIACALHDQINNEVFTNTSFNRDWYIKQ